MLVAILGFSLGRQLAAGSGKARPRILLWTGSLAIVLGLGCAVSYLVSFARYVVSDQQAIGNETRKIRLVIGTELVGRSLAGVY